MKGRVLALLGVLAIAGTASAEQPVVHPAECRVAEQQVQNIFALPHVEKAIAAKRLSILVLGAGSSLLPGSAGTHEAYPARLQHALTDLLPGVEIKLATDVKSKRTALEMAQALSASLTASKPQLVIWQTGTADAIQAVDVDQFKQALDQGIDTARKAGADVIFINPQYSPRTESMIALSTYAENMRWVAVQQEVPLFDRFSIMKTWADLGTFDLYSATKKLDMAERVHDCIGRLLADLIIEANKPGEPNAAGIR